MTDDRTKLIRDGAFNARWAKILGLWAMVAVVACGQRGDVREGRVDLGAASDAVSVVPPRSGGQPSPWSLDEPSAPSAAAVM